MSFNNKVVLVTGASSGIGAATAVVFAGKGADVVLVGRNEANLSHVANQCSTVGKKALTIKADVSKDADCNTIIKKTIERYGKLDILVNNAGIFRECPILDKNLVSVFDEMFNTNMRSIVVLTGLAAPYLVEAGGNIVNVSSVAAQITPAHGFSSYCASKAALSHFSKVCASELAEKGVRVNIVSPGPVETSIMKFTNCDFSWEQAKGMTALNKVSQPAEVGELIAYLAGDNAGSITGSEFVIDCGVLVNKSKTPSYTQ